MEEENVEAQDLQEPIAEPVAAEPTAEEPALEVDWEAKAKELEATNKQLFARAKKAEAAAKPTPAASAEPAAQVLSGKDILALSAKGVTDEEDVDWLSKEVAPLYSGSITKALGNKLVTDMLAARREERQTANASSSGNTRRAPTDRSGTALLNDAVKGTLPESKSDIVKLVRTRIGIDKK
jgi:hypothetical protein